MLDRFLAIEGISPNVALVAAFSKQGNRLHRVADELERLALDQSVIPSGRGAAPADPMRIAKWIAHLANRMISLSKSAGSRVGLPDKRRDWTGLMPTLNKSLNLLWRSVKQLDGLIQVLSINGDATDATQTVEDLTQLRDRLKDVIAELQCIGTFVGRIGLPFFDPEQRLSDRLPEQPLSNHRRGCRDPDRLAQMRQLLQSGHTIPQVIRATGIPKGIAYYLFHHYLAEDFPHAKVRRPKKSFCQPTE